MGIAPGGQAHCLQERLEGLLQRQRVVRGAFTSVEEFFRLGNSTSWNLPHDLVCLITGKKFSKSRDATEDRYNGLCYRKEPVEPALDHRVRRNE